MLLAVAMAFALGPSGQVCGAEKPLLVHYMPWFVAPPHASSWGYHWTMNVRDPGVVEESGGRQIAAHYHPAIGPYDSADPAVLEYHVLLMKLAGIDGIIVDWYGMDDVHDYAANERRTQAVRDAALRAGLSFCLCYEDRTVGAAINSGAISADQALAHGQETLRYAQHHYFANPAYFRLADGRPVLLNFGPQFFRGPRQWAALFSVLDATNQPALFTQDRRLATAEGAFNWPPMHLSQTNGGTLSASALETYLDRFEAASRRWPAFVSSAFPRFHDYYQEAGVRESYGRLADNGGAVFRTTLARAMTNDSVFIQLVTWNDFGEGTVLEPTLEFGYRDLGVLQDMRRRYFDTAFPNTISNLQLATRFYQLRRQHINEMAFTMALDEAFEWIVKGELQSASAGLSRLEAGDTTPESAASEAAGRGQTQSEMQAAGEILAEALRAVGAGTDVR